MTRILITKKIAAPIEVVFKTVADINQFSQAIPHIVNVQILSDIKSGVRTRFRETRLMQGKKHVTELEVTEYEANRRVRLVTDANGTIWDTVFTVEDREGTTRLEMTMDAKAQRLTAKIVNSLIKGVVQHAIDGDLDRVKKYCESNHANMGDDG